MTILLYMMETLRVFKKAMAQPARLPPLAQQLIGDSATIHRLSSDRQTLPCLRQECRRSLANKSLHHLDSARMVDDNRLPTTLTSLDTTP